MGLKLSLFLNNLAEITINKGNLKIRLIQGGIILYLS